MLVYFLQLLLGGFAVNTEGTFYRCYEGSIHQFTDIPSGNPEEMMKILDTSKPTAIFVHGWQESCGNNSAIEISSAILSRGAHNVCCLDWSTISKSDYISAAGQTDAVAETFASDIKALYDLDFPSKQPWCIGFSLGAHICGYMGGKLIERGYKPLSRISGLDPAFPRFYFPTCVRCNALNKSCAEMVDVMHTDKGFFGAPVSTGTCDFYPNNGMRIQRGCPFVPPTANPTEFLSTYRCSHDRSWEFSADAISKNGSHVAIKCDSAASFANNACSNNPTVVLGIDLPNDTSGTYYYITNQAPPYGRREQGTHP